MTEYLPLIICVGVTLLIGVIEKKVEKRKERRASRQMTSPRVTPEQSSEWQAPYIQSVLSSLYESHRVNEESVADTAADVVVEGERVTDAQPDLMEPVSDASGLKAPSIDELRRAVIWGEILHRKF